MKPKLSSRFEKKILESNKIQEFLAEKKFEYITTTFNETGLVTVLLYISDTYRIGFYNVVPENAIGYKFSYLESDEEVSFDYSMEKFWPVFFDNSEAKVWFELRDFIPFEKMERSQEVYIKGADDFNIRFYNLIDSFDYILKKVKKYNKHEEAQ